MKILAYSILSVLVFFHPFEHCKGQNFVSKFPKEVLSQPITNSIWFDTNIDLVEIPLFVGGFSQYDLLIENGYALHQFTKPISIDEIKSLGEIVSVDIIFTKYPLQKEDWITNYYILLANRLKALFTLDSTINNNKIQWRLVMQTSCKTENEAVKLFHGIGIKCNKQNLVKIEPIPVNPIYVEKIVDIPYIPCNNKLEPVGIVNDSIDIGIIYPEGIWNREVKPTPPTKTKKTSEPPCPKFTTRMEKPKRSLVDRLRGR